MIRQPAVSGRFYPAQPDELIRTIQTFLEPVKQRNRGIGLVVPHAGYVYSGHVAGAVYSRVDLPSRNLVLCPNHTGFGPPLSMMKAGSWRTPLGEMQIDEDLSTALIAEDPYLRDDTEAHDWSTPPRCSYPSCSNAARRIYVSFRLPSGPAASIACRNLETPWRA